MSNNEKVSKSNPVLKKYQDKIEDIGEIFKKEPVNFLMANALLHLNEEQLIELRDKLISRTPKDKEIIDDEFIAKQYSNSTLNELEKWIDENKMPLQTFPFSSVRIDNQEIVRLNTLKSKIKSLKK